MTTRNGTISRTTSLRDYVELTQPRIVVMVLVTTLAGFYLGSHGAMDLALLLHTLIGTALVVGSANTLNQLVERDSDARMRRTQNRPLPAGRLETQEAFLSGSGMVVVGLFYLAVGVNTLTALLALAAWGIYLFLYTPLKKRTQLSIQVGAVSGALPPVIGWAGARGALSLESFALFAILFFWQLPHFMAIAWMYREDYARAGFPMTPVVDPTGKQTARQIIVYALALVPVSVAPTLLGLAGKVYFFGALALALAFLAVGLRVATSRSDADAKRLLYASLLFLPLLLVLMMLDRGAL